MTFRGPPVVVRSTAAGPPATINPVTSNTAAVVTTTSTAASFLRTFPSLLRVLSWVCTLLGGTQAPPRPFGSRSGEPGNAGRIRNDAVAVRPPPPSRHLSGRSIENAPEVYLSGRGAPSPQVVGGGAGERANWVWQEGEDVSRHPLCRISAATAAFRAGNDLSAHDLPLVPPVLRSFSV